MDEKIEELYFGIKRKNNPDAPKSIYAENYVKVSVKRPDLIVLKPDFPDIVAGPFIDPLLPDSKLSSQTECEKADDFYERVTEKYPSLKKVVLPETVDQSKITKEYKLSDKTIYQIDYSNEGESYESKYSRLRQRIKLPPDWGPIPRTTQRRSYREWKKLVPWNVKPAKPFKPPETELGVNKEEQRLLNITTGKSEYEENISGVGDDIMHYAFFGEVKPLPHEYRRNNYGKVRTLPTRQPKIPISMDYFLTTYRKDYKWPVAHSIADVKKAGNEQKMREVQLKDADPHMMEARKPMVQSNVELGTVIPAQSGASPQGEASKYDQPNAYLQKLYRKYPYLYNIMKFTTTDDMAKRIMSEKYKSTYQVEFSREDDFSTLADVVKHGEQPQEVSDEAKEPGICLPEGIPPPKCKCAKGLAFSPCQCAKEVPVRRIAWKPAPISKIPQFPREKKKKKKEETEDDKPKLSGKGSSTPLKPFSTEYNETISKIGWLIIKNKLLHKETIEAAEQAGRRKSHLESK